MQERLGGAGCKSKFWQSGKHFLKNKSWKLQFTALEVEGCCEYREELLLFKNSPRFLPSCITNPTMPVSSFTAT